jgi:hypothetical protein
VLVAFIFGGIILILILHSIPSSESPPVDDVAQLIDDDDGDDAGATLSSSAIAAQVRHHLVELITCVSTRAALEELRDEGVSSESLELTQKRLWDAERRTHLDRVTKFARDVRRHLHEIKQRYISCFIVWLYLFYVVILDD